MHGFKAKNTDQKLQGRSSAQYMDRHVLELSRFISYFKHTKYASIHNTAYHIMPVQTADAFPIGTTNFCLLIHTALLSLTNKLPLCQKKRKKTSPRLSDSLSFADCCWDSKNLPTKHNLSRSLLQAPGYRFTLL